MDSWGCLAGQNFTVWPWNLFTSWSEVLSDVCKSCTLGPIFFSPFWPGIGSKFAESQVYYYFLKKFTPASHQSCFTGSLELLLEVCWMWAPEAWFFSHFGPLNRSKLWPLVIFPQKFPVVWHKFYFICSLELVLQVCRIWAKNMEPIKPPGLLFSNFQCFHSKMCIWTWCLQMCWDTSVLISHIWCHLIWLWD